MQATLQLPLNIQK